MNSADTETMTALQALLEERQRYGGWIRTLESRRNNTPPHVYERVFSDYLQRLEEVRERLATHTEQLRGTVAALTAKLDELRTRESDRIDTRTEAELRAAVGEYGEEQWTQIREEADLEIEIMAQEREELERELTELEKIVASSEASEVDETNSSAGESVPAGDSRGRSEVAEAGSAGQPSGHNNDAQETHRSNEKEFNRAPSLNDFVDWPARRDASGASAQSDGAPQAPQVADNAAVAASVVSSKAASPGHAKSAAPSKKTPPSGVSAQPRQVTAEPPRRDNEKSLQCPECGTMNYATEWYCERCGGELATI